MTRAEVAKRNKEGKCKGCYEYEDCDYLGDSYCFHTGILDQFGYFNFKCPLCGKRNNTINMQTRDWTLETLWSKNPDEKGRFHRGITDTGHGYTQEMEDERYVQLVTRCCKKVWKEGKSKAKLMEAFYTMVEREYKKELVLSEI